MFETCYWRGFQADAFPHGVQGVVCSNHTVPTKKIKDLRRAALCGFFLFQVLVRNLVRKNSPLLPTLLGYLTMNACDYCAITSEVMQAINSID
jgi:hypothetical protein